MDSSVLCFIGLIALIIAVFVLATWKAIADERATLALHNAATRDNADDDDDR